MMWGLAAAGGAAEAVVDGGAEAVVGDVTTATSHIEDMVSMYEDRVQAAYENSSPRQYLFTTHKEIRSHDVLTLPWLDATGKARARLL